MIQLRKSCLAALSVGVLGFCSLTAARAQVFLTDGNFGGGNNGNVLVDQDVNVGTMHIDASLNGGITGAVNVDSTENITGQGQGQATFVPVDGALNNICFSIKDNNSVPQFF